MKPMQLLILVAALIAIDQLLWGGDYRHAAWQQLQLAGDSFNADMARWMPNPSRR